MSSPYWPTQTEEEIKAATAAALAEIQVREARRKAALEITVAARAQARATVKVRQSRLSEAGLAAIIAGGPPRTLRQRAARRRLKHLRSAQADYILGWHDIKDVARELGMDARKLSAILRGERDIPLRKACALAELLDVPLDEVVKALILGRT